MILFFPIFNNISQLEWLLFIYSSFFIFLIDNITPFKEKNDKFNDNNKPSEKNKLTDKDNVVEAMRLTFILNSKFNNKKI